MTNNNDALPEFKLRYFPDVKELAEHLWEPDGSINVSFLYLVVTIVSIEFADDMVADLRELMAIRTNAEMSRESTANVVLGELLAFQDDVVPPLHESNTIATVGFQPSADTNTQSTKLKLVNYDDEAEFVRYPVGNRQSSMINEWRNAMLFGRAHREYERCGRCHS